MNGVCGAATITGFNVFINRHSTNYREIFKPDNRYLTVVHYLEKLHPKAILEVRDTILQYMADLIIANATGTITFGGRCNINRVAYLGSFGVHSGTFARHIVRNKLGTITCSHLHQNTSHRSYDDFSLQQVFIWSPPQVDVMPIDRRYCGIFRDTKHPLKGLERILADFKKATKEWVMLKPRYALKDPFTPDNEGIVK